MEPGSLAGLLNLETGLLPPEETAVLEHLYGTAQEKLTAAPDITEVDEDQIDDITLILSALREVEGQACYQAFLFSSPEPLGLYDFQIRMTPLTEDADTVDIVSTLHEKACALYSDPSTDPGLSSISDRLEDPLRKAPLFRRHGPQGDQTNCTIQLMQANGMSAIAIFYRLTMDTSAGLG